MPHAVSVRHASVADAEVVGQLLYDFNVEFDTPTPDAAFFSRRFTDLLARPDVFVILADASVEGGEDGKAVGFAYATLRPTPYDDGPLAQLEELYVRPSRRDGGIGTAILTAVLDEVRARGGGEVHINVDEIDHDTRRFYERHGFVNILPGEDYRMLCYLQEL